MSRRTYTWNAFETTLTSGIDATTGTIPLASVTGLRSPGILVIDYDDPAKREYIKYASISSLDLTSCTRGLAGSAGGAGSAHSSGATVKAVAVHQFYDDLFSDIEDLESADTIHDTDIAALEAADTAHFGVGGAAHADATLTVAGFMSGADKSKLANIESNATADQTGAEILTALLPVDGAGSWLDADLLDGIEGAELNVLDAIEVNLTSDEALTTGAETEVPWDSTAWSSGDAGTEDGIRWVSGTPTRLTTNKAGLYYFIGQLYFSSAGSGFNIRAELKKNGVTFAHVQVPGDGSSPFQICGYAHADNNDYFELAVWHNKGSNLDMRYQDCWFQAVRQHAHTVGI